MALRTQGNLLLNYYKFIIKDTNEHPNEEIQKARSGSVQNTGASSDPKYFALYHPPGVWIQSPTQKLSESQFLVFAVPCSLWDLSYPTID